MGAGRFAAPIRSAVAGSANIPTIIGEYDTVKRSLRFPVQVAFRTHRDVWKTTEHLCYTPDGRPS